MASGSLSKVLGATNRVIKDLESSRLFLASIFNELTDIVALITGDGDVIFTNDTFLKRFNLLPSQILNQSIKKVLDQNTSEIFFSKLASLSDATNHVEFQTILTREDEDHSYHWVLNKYANTEHYGDVILVTSRDITELLTSRKRVEQVYQKLPVGILTVDKNGIIDGPYSNYLETLFGTYKIEGSHLADLLETKLNIEAEKVENVRAVLGSVGKSEKFFATEIVSKSYVVIELDATKDSGNPSRWLKLNFYPIVQEGFVESFFVVVQNMTTLVNQRRQNEELRRLSLVDSLTELGNRRHFDKYLGEQWDLVQHHNVDLGLIMIDIDYFKLFNDHLGHKHGDDVLTSVGRAIKASLRRDMDLAFRYGGEEFAIILPNTAVTGTVHVAEFIRASIEALKIEHPSRPGEPKLVTISVGVASVSQTVAITLDEGDFIELADKALYRSKESGRNRVSVYRAGPE